MQSPRPAPHSPERRHPPKLLASLREALRARHYSPRTEQAYIARDRRYVQFHRLKHLGELADPEINVFLSHLALKEDVSASTQNQVLAALLFLHRYVIGRQRGELAEIIRARKPARLPVGLSRDDIAAVFACLEGDRWLAASLMYGSDLRLMEGLHLRVQGVSFASREILVRDGKGGKVGVTMLPESLAQPLQDHLRRVRAIHDRTLADGWGWVQMPDALSCKYPLAAREWHWQWVFPFVVRLSDLTRLIFIRIRSG